MSEGAGERERGASRARVRHEPGGVAGANGDVAASQRRVGRQGLEAVAPGDLDHLGHRARALVHEERLARGHLEPVRVDGLDPALEGAGLDRLLDGRLDADLERGEERVLLVDGKRKQAIEEPRHRRQVLADHAVVGELQARRLLEPFERPLGHRPAAEREVELAERRLRVRALEVVACPEERRVPAAHRGLGVALPAGDGPERCRAVAQSSR